MKLQHAFVWQQDISNSLVLEWVHLTYIHQARYMVFEKILPITLNVVLSKLCTSNNHTDISTVICNFSPNNFSRPADITLCMERLYDNSTHAQGNVAGIIVGF